MCLQLEDESNKLTYYGGGLLAPQKSVILAPKIHNSKPFRAKTIKEIIRFSHNFWDVVAKNAIMIKSTQQMSSDIFCQCTQSFGFTKQEITLRSRNYIYVDPMKKAFWYKYMTTYNHQTPPSD